MSDARRRAEEALRYDHDHANSPKVRRRLRGAIEALLAAGPEGKAPGHDRIAELESLLRECNAVCLCGCPETEHESYGEDGESCADEGHECIRVAPAVLEIVQRYRVALAGTPAPRPAQDAVREAAERLRATLDRTCGKYLGGPRLPLVNDLEEHAARLLAALDARGGGE